MSIHLTSVFVDDQQKALSCGNLIRILGEELQGGT